MGHPYKGALWDGNTVELAGKDMISDTSLSMQVGPEMHKCQVWAPGHTGIHTYPKHACNTELQHPFPSIKQKAGSQDRVSKVCWSAERSSDRRISAED